MGFDDDFAAGLDALADRFGQPAVYCPAGGAELPVILAVEADYVEPDLDDGAGRRQLRVVTGLLRTADVASVKKTDRIEYDGETFAIDSIRRGAGCWAVRLVAARRVEATRPGYRE